MTRIVMIRKADPELAPSNELPHSSPAGPVGFTTTGAELSSGGLGRHPHIKHLPTDAERRRQWRELAGTARWDEPDLGRG